MIGMNNKDSVTLPIINHINKQASAQIVQLLLQNKHPLY